MNAPPTTPGPWHNDGLIIYDNEGTPIATLLASHRAVEEWDGNAPLIGAAPDLLDALRMVRDADEDCRRDGLPTIPTSARFKVDAAIEKAEGRS